MDTIVNANCPWSWKRRFEHDYEATAELWRLSRSQTLRSEGKLIVFKCQSKLCGGWHIGTQKGFRFEAR